MYKVQKKDIQILKESKSIPVGTSHPMMRLKILKNKKEVQKGKIGEICMIGDCVSQGYIGHNKNSKNYFQIYGTNKNKMSLLLTPPRVHLSLFMTTKKSSFIIDCHASFFFILLPEAFL